MPEERGLYRKMTARKVLAYFGAIKGLNEKSEGVLRDIIVKASDINTLNKAIREKKVAKISWCGREECAEKIKEEGAGEIRGYRFDGEKKPASPCLVCGGKAKIMAYAARAY